MTRSSWAQLLGLSALWGASYLFISIALTSFGPFAVSFGRVAGAALVLFPFWWRRRAALRGKWHLVALVAVPEIALPFTLINTGERSIDSGLAGTLVALAPLWLVVLGPLLGQGRPTAKGLGGTLVGLVGVAILLGGVGTGAQVNLAGAGLVVLAAASYAVGAALLGRWLTGIDAVTITGATTAAAALALVPFTAFDLPDQAPSLAAVGALAVLAVGGTAAGLVLFNQLITTVGPGRASLVSYLAPTFAVVYGALLLREPVGPGTFGGLGLVLLGSWLCSRKPKSGAAETQVEADLTVRKSPARGT
jgi:drug/metabolite transporter (DMT)-like permease